MKKVTLESLDLFNSVKWELDHQGHLNNIGCIGDDLYAWCRETQSDCICSFSDNRISIWVDTKNERYSMSLTELLRTFPKPISLSWESKNRGWDGVGEVVTEFIWSFNGEKFTLWLFDATNGNQ